MAQNQMTAAGKLSNYRFSPSWLGLLIVMICVPGFIKLGLWQYGKAKQGESIQANQQQSETQPMLPLPLTIDHPESLNYKKVLVKGHYDTRYQILLDNQVEAGRAGFHVITPLKIDNSEQYVLINRGWIPGNDIHSELPEFTTPAASVEIAGMVWTPGKKIFSLEKQTEKTAWHIVWQNMDLQRYRNIVPLKVLPIVIKLDPASAAGGFVRNWQLPAKKIATNLGYAYQWFGFAAATVLIYIFTSFKKRV